MTFGATHCQTFCANLHKNELDPDKDVCLVAVADSTAVVALPHSMVGVVVAEFLAGNKGLGFLLTSNASQFNAAGTFAAVFVLATISFALDRLLNLMTRRALIWKQANILE